MNSRDARTDRAIADALRTAAGEPYEGSLDSLAVRIDVAATPILAARRQGGQRPAAWWDFAAEWARMLVPVGLSIAAASVMLLWIMRPVVPVAAQPVSSRGPSPIVVAMRGAAAPDLVDRAVEELVSGPAAPAIQRRAR
jgi:hypothetical protein